MALRVWRFVSCGALILYVGVMTEAISTPECWLVGVRPLRVEGRDISPQDRPDSQLLSCPDCISMERTKSYQTSQWRERSPPSQCWRKGKWKLMNRNPATMAQRQFTRGKKFGTERSPTCSCMFCQAFAMTNMIWIHLTKASNAKILQLPTSRPTQNVSKVHYNLWAQKCHQWVGYLEFGVF